MVFCYKIITESPSRSAAAAVSPSSPTKRSPDRRNAYVTSAIPQFASIVNNDTSSSADLNSVPEREWRLLAVLAKKREQDDEREELADQFRKMWQKEKEERDVAQVESLEQYKRYLQEKREQERSWLEYKRQQIARQQQMRQGQLLECIRHKEKRSADLLANLEDRKVSHLVHKVLGDTAKSQLAADRRMRQSEESEWKRQWELEYIERKVDDARRRRNTLLRDASKRLAISNTLTTWETMILRKELSAIEATRRGQISVQIALTDAKSQWLARARDVKQRRARKMANLTAQLRDFVRMGNRWN